MNWCGGLDAAVSAGDVETITRQVQNEIENVLQPGRLRLDERFRRTLQDHYARRLLYRDPARRYTILVLGVGPPARGRRSTTTPISGASRGCWKGSWR